MNERAINLERAMKHKPPKLPRELYGNNRSCGEIQNRNRERARIMREHYGIPFSHCRNNPLGVKQAKAKGIPGAGYPKAIYSHKSIEPVSDPDVLQRVTQSFHKWKSPFNKCTFTTIVFDTNLTFLEVMGAVKFMHSQNPHGVTFSVDRLGKPTVFGLAKDKS